MSKPWYEETVDLSKGWICPTCKKQLPSGIVGISAHWAECGGKEFHDALVEAKEKEELDYDKYLELLEKRGTTQSPPPSGESS